ncbi:phosphatase PAP2 family protein [Leptolyngbya sp. 15MV]|nr:phosphatase PAP2 family protein [Leptolyngbya sp. 15MV]
MLWTGAAERRWWARPGLWALVAFAALLPFDGAISRAALWLNGHVGGDVRRELHALQQYGQFTVSVVVGVAVWLADPARRSRLVGWAVAWVIAAGLVYPMKILVGRPRPRFGDGEIHPLVFLGPTGAWPLGVDRSGEPRGVRHAWELWAGISSDLHAMPSSHTAYAVVMSAFLSRLYPALRPVLVFLACLVGFCRVLFGAHFATDVAVGAAIGILAVRLSVDRGVGERVRGWLTGAKVGPAL